MSRGFSAVSEFLLTHNKIDRLKCHVTLQMSTLFCLFHTLCSLCSSFLASCLDFEDAEQGFEVKRSKFMRIFINRHSY